MIDKNYCMSSYLALRYIERDDCDFYPGMRHQTVKLPKPEETIPIENEIALKSELTKVFSKFSDERKGILLSGGMDSACLAAMMNVVDYAYTFRFMNGSYESEELHRAEHFAEINKLNLRYVDIEWEKVNEVLPLLMKEKGAPVHSIEPQIYIAAMQAKSDGVSRMIIGDAADYVFYGMDGLLSRDWLFDEFYDRAIYIRPEDALKEPYDMHYVFETYRKGDRIDFVGFYDKCVTEESYASYDNAFRTANMPFVDPYECFRLAEPLDLARTRAGDSKYHVRALFRLLYPNERLPEKHPMPRPVDFWFREWEGPVGQEFRSDLNLSTYTGNQKWLLYCLDRFLSIHEPN